MSLLVEPRARCEPSALEFALLDQQAVLQCVRRNAAAFGGDPTSVRHPFHVRLVTISARYGSGLRTYAGEGLVGLAWAFLRAGSHNVIGALWQADDASTPLMMGRLYTQIEAGRSPDEALREDKLVLIRAANVYRKPFYWGVFQLYAGS